MKKILILCRNNSDARRQNTRMPVAAKHNGGKLVIAHVADGEAASVLRALDQLGQVSSYEVLSDS